LPRGGQTVVTATELPSVVNPDLVVGVTPGKAVAA
jgi:hypothetical protein